MAIFYAIETGSNSTIESILKYNPKIDHLNSRGETPLTLLFKNNLSRDLIEKILESVPNEALLKTILDENLVIANSELEWFDLVKILLKKGYDVNTINEKGTNLLWVSLDKFLKGSANMVSVNYLQTFIEYGTNWNFVDEINGESILMKLVFLRHKSDIEFVNKLLDLDVFNNINQVDLVGNSALVYALRNPSDNASTVDILLQKGANLHYREQDLEIIEELVDDPALFRYNGIYPYEAKKPQGMTLSTASYFESDELKHNFWVQRNKKMLLLWEHGLSFDTKKSLEQKDLTIPLEKIVLMLIRKSTKDEFLPIISLILRESKIDMGYGGSSFLTQAIVQISFGEKTPKHNYGIVGMLLNHGADYKQWYPEEKPFTSYLDPPIEAHNSIWQIIQQIEYLEHHHKYFVLKAIRKFSPQFTLSPDSLIARLTNIKWQLQQKSATEVYIEVDEKLKAYFGIYDEESLSIKVSSHSSWLE